MIIQNAIEFAVYVAISFNSDYGETWIGNYMISVYFLIYAYVYFVGTSTNLIPPRLLKILVSIPILLCILQLNGLLIDGYKRTGISVITQPGDYYLTFQLYTIISISLSYLCLIYSIKKPLTPVIEARSILLFVGLFPVSLAGMMVVTLRLMGSEMSSLIFLPITSLFFFVSATLCNEKDLFKIAGTLIAFRSGMHKHVLISEPVEQSISFKDRLKEIEKFLLKQAYEHALADPEYRHSPQKRVAYLLGISESTVSKKMNSYEIRTRAND